MWDKTNVTRPQHSPQCKLWATKSHWGRQLDRRAVSQVEELPRAPGGAEFWEQREFRRGGLSLVRSWVPSPVSRAVLRKMQLLQKPYFWPPGSFDSLDCTF